MRSRPRRVFYGWWIVVAGSVINTVGGGINHYGFTVFFLPLTRELHLDRASTSLVFAASRLEGGLFSPVAGWLIHRLGPRRVILAGATLTGLGYILFSQAHAFWVVLVVYVFVISLGFNAGSYTAVNTAVNVWFIRYRALAMGITAAANALGGFLIVPLLAFSVQTWGWRSAALVAAIITWVFVLPAALAMHRSPESRGLYPDGRPPLKGSGEASERGHATADAFHDFSPAQAVRTWSYWLLTGSIAVRLGAQIALTVHLIPILVWKGVDEVTAAFLVSMLALGTVPLFVLFGWLGDRFSKTRLSALGIFVAVAGALGLLLLPAWPGIALFVLSLAIINGSSALNWTLIADFFGRKGYAVLLGLMGPLHSLWSFASPIFAGWVYDRTQSYTAALATFAALFAVAGTMFLLLHGPRPAQRASSH